MLDAVPDTDERQREKMGDFDMAKSLGARRTLLLATTTARKNQALAQSSAESDSPKAETSDLVIHQNVRRVVVDVVVSDSSGKPVSGLSARDFSVAEDGKSQRIRSFDVHDFDSTAGSLPKRPTSLPTNTFVNLPSSPERGPLYVLLLDLLNMEVDDQPAAREQLLKFARSKPLGTRFAVFVLSDGFYLLQGFDAVICNYHLCAAGFEDMADKLLIHFNIFRNQDGFSKQLFICPGGLHVSICFFGSTFLLTCSSVRHFVSCGK